ncbi:MAG: NUDIX hydrolase [Spirochaetota bacterium]
MEELLEEWSWDEGKPLGTPVKRSYAHKNGIPHEGVHLWVLNMADGIPLVLFQHRAHWKDMYPDCLDITVGGHVPFGLGEAKIQKEAYEEIGITPSDDDLVDLGYFRYEERDENIFHREFQHVYLYEDSRALDRYVFHDKEVEGIFAVQLDMLKKLLDQDFKFSIKGFNGREILHRNVQRQDFHPLLFSPTMEQYMNILIQAMDQYARGKVVTVFF